MERIGHFLFSLLLLGSITAALWIYQIVMRRRWKKKLDSIAWLKENRWKAFWRLSGPEIHLLLPFREELIFRAPLIVAFGSLSPHAWIAVLLAAAVVAAFHSRGNQLTLSEVLSEHEKRHLETDSLKEAISFLKEAKKKEIRIRRLSQPLHILPLGILTGYYGIQYQSIWVAVGIHVSWNLLFPILFRTFFPVAMFIIGTLIDLCILLCKLLWKRLATKKSPE